MNLLLAFLFFNRYEEERRDARLLHNIIPSKTGKFAWKLLFPAMVDSLSTWFFFQERIKIPLDRTSSRYHFVGDKLSQRMNNKELRTLRKKTRTMNKTWREMNKEKVKSYSSTKGLSSYIYKRGLRKVQLP